MYIIQVGSIADLFVILLVLNCLLGRTTSDKARFDTLTYEWNPELVNISGGIDSKGILNVDYDLWKPLNTIYVHLTAFHHKNKEKTIILDRVVNLCKAFKVKGFSRFILGAVQMMQNTSNFSSVCPVKQGRYFTHNFNLRDLKLPPGRAMGLPRILNFDTTLTRDKQKDEKANTENGKVFVIKIKSQISLLK